MKKFASILLFQFLALHLLAQPKTIKISGVVKDTSIKSIELRYMNSPNLIKWESKKINIVNGAFTTSLQILFPTKLFVNYPKRDFKDHFINGDAEFFIDPTGKMEIFHSAIQDEYEKEFLPFFQPNQKVLDSLMSFYRRYGGKFSPTVNDSVIPLREKYGYGRCRLLEEYIKQHPDSYVALWDIYSFVNNPGSYKYFDFEKLFSTFSKQVQAGAFINILKAKIKESNSLEAGKILPKDFFEGHGQTHDTIRNNCRYYLLDFWYSHCGPCIGGFPKLKEIYQRFHEKGFEIVSFSTDQKEYEKDYFEAINKYELKWHHIWDIDGKLATKYNINSFPTYILIDKNDSIINRSIKIEELEQFLTDHL